MELTKQPDLNEFFNGDLTLPWRGRVWTVPEPTAKESERLLSLVYSEELVGPREVYEIRRLLQQTWHDLVDAGIGWAHLMHFGRTALIYYTGTPEMAYGYWTMGQLALSVDLDLLLAAKAKEAELKRLQAKLVAEVPL